MQPQTNPKSRICLQFDGDGLTAYCNREALVDLRDQLDWLTKAPPDEFWHCHILWSLENDASRFDGRRPSNAGVVIEDGFDRIVSANLDASECVDLTFVVLSEREMDDVQKRQK